MSYGLRIWDASGNLKLSITDRLLRVVGTVSGSLGPGQTVSIPIPASDNPVYISVIASSPSFPSQYSDMTYKVKRYSTYFTMSNPSSPAVTDLYIVRFFSP